MPREDEKGFNLENELHNPDILSEVGRLQAVLNVLRATGVTREKTAHGLRTITRGTNELTRLIAFSDIKTSFFLKIHVTVNLETSLPFYNANRAVSKKIMLIFFGFLLFSLRHLCGSNCKIEIDFLLPK
jgi:hypothetical protein